MKNVDSLHPAYAEMQHRWQITRDNTENRVKEKASTYLIKNQSHLNDPDKFNRFAERSVFYPITAHTHSTFTGLIFSEGETIKEIPKALEAATQNINGSNLNLDEQVQQATGEVLSQGRAGLLVDFPTVEGAENATLADVEAGRFTPRVLLYKAEQVVNWRSNDADPSKLDLLVLHEVVQDRIDTFKTEAAEQWRVYQRSEAGAIEVVVYRRDENDKDMFIEYVAPLLVRDSRGDMSDIPWVWIGAENNDAKPDMPPMFGLAQMNVAHFRNSAGYEMTAHLAGSPTPFASGLTENWVTKFMADKVALGAESLIKLPAGGTLGMIQANPSSMEAEAMRSKEAIMIGLGARLVMPSDQIKTATQANIENKNTTSILSQIARNVSSAYEKALTIALAFISTDDAEIVYQINDDFTALSADAPMLAEILRQYQGGGLTFGEYRAYVKKIGVAHEEDTDASDLIDIDVIDNDA